MNENKEVLTNRQKQEQFTIEQVREFLPQLRRFHDIFEDRSVMSNPEIADFVAGQFTSAGVETLVDFVEELKVAKEKQIGRINEKSSRR
jgi:hypothetical protein